MNYEELCRALAFFHDTCCCCAQGGAFSSLDWSPAFLRDESLSYKIKKAKLLKQYGNVIQYIKNFYSMPVKPQEKKHLSKITYYGISGFCCEWHATALAQRGSADAQHALGGRLIGPSGISEQYGRYINYKGWEEDKIKEDILWLKLAAEKGITDAYWVLGVANYKLKKYENAIDWYKAGARKGDVNCMVSLGDICIDDLHDAAAALQWFVPAAQKGALRARLECAKIYSENTKNTKANYRLAIKYYKEFIEQVRKEKNKYHMRFLKHYKEEIKKLELKIED